MKKRLTILIGKLVLFLCKIIGRGSAMPGTFTYKLNKNIVNYFKLPNTVIAVTGSSGKGSTSKIIANVYKKFGYKVAYNSKGSNERSAIITTLLENSKLNGKIKTDVCVFEMDERYAKYVFPYIKPTHVVITNITKDQPPRQGHIDIVYKDLLNAIDENTELIINADDPYLQKFNIDKKYKTYYYGLNKTSNSYKKNKFEVLNVSRCLKCNTPLEYDYYHIEDIGSYKCHKCDFKRPNSDFEITSFNKNVITINDNYKMNIKNNMLYNLYNTVAAFAALSINNLDNEKICLYISELNKDKKIFDYYKYKNKKVYVLNNKNENASTFNQSILYTQNDKDLKTIVIGWRQISRRYEFDDLSWLYDIEFELLNNKNTASFIVAGPQRYDIAVRLKYAGIDEKKIKIFEDLKMAEKTIKLSKGNIYAILNFDYVEPFNKIMEEVL